VKETLEAINQMQADGVIGHYAIGGAVGATFYLEPAATYDVVPSNDLEREAVAGSLATKVDGVNTWVMPEEHLVAIALQTGRTKDYLRIMQFIEQRALDMKALQAIIERHGLTEKWKQFERRFLEGTNG
jgi:hypothetical protein